MTEQQRIDVTVNGTRHEMAVEPRLLLSDFLRHELGLTGTHVGCEHGVCGACTVLLDGEAVRSCLVFAVQTDGHSIETVEGLGSERSPPSAPAGVPRNPRPAMRFLHSRHPDDAGAVPAGAPAPTEHEIREALSGHLCRCTGYANIVYAVALAAQRGPGASR